MEQINYLNYLEEINTKLSEYFEIQKDFICCKKGCSKCCEKGEYPLSEIELNYLMQGYCALENSLKIRVQNNIKTMIKGEACPFLLDNQCSVYEHRPLICRIHGLAYVSKNGFIKIPYCATCGLNFSEHYSNGKFSSEPIKRNLDELMMIGEIRSLYDWIY